jgi:hypothetical protein
MSVCLDSYTDDRLCPEATEAPQWSGRVVAQVTWEAMKSRVIRGATLTKAGR